MQNEVDKIYLLMLVKQWLNGAILQGNRILNIQKQIEELFPDSKKLAILSDPEREQYLQNFMQNSRANGNRTNELREIQRLDEHFFIISANHTLQFLRESKGKIAGIKPLFEKFHSIPHIDEMRDMLEHQKEYLKGKGDNQDKWLHRTGIITADASASIIKDGEYWLGNRLSVQEIMNLAAEILPEIEKILNEEMNKPTQRAHKK